MPFLMQRNEVKAMNIIEMKLSELKPYENNPRKNDDAVEYVANSIKEFGFKVPIVIDKDNVIIAGHTRYKASQELGLETVPVIVADDLTEEQVRAFRIADNSTAETSWWDYTKLDEELEKILDIDLADFGLPDPDGIDIDSLFEEKEIEEEAPKTMTIICPDCGREIVIDKKGNIVQ